MIYYDQLSDIPVDKQYELINLVLEYLSYPIKTDNWLS